MGRGEGSNGSSLLYGRPNPRRRGHGHGSTMPAVFDHPRFEPTQQSLKLDHYFIGERPTTSRARGLFSGTNWWAARASTIPAAWRPEAPKLRLGAYHLDLWFKRVMEPDGLELIDSVRLGEPLLGVGAYFADVDAADIEHLKVDADHAMAAFKLAGEHGYWQLAYRRAELPHKSTLVLRDELDDDILAFVRIASIH